MTEATPLASEQITRIALEDVTPAIAAAFADDTCLIWSGEWQAYWRDAGNSYTKSASEAGLFTIEAAYASTRHCGPEKQIAFERAALSASPAPSGQGAFERYDAGLLGDGGGGDVEWWQDYLRAELERAHDFYADQWENRS